MLPVIVTLLAACAGLLLLLVRVVVKMNASLARLEQLLASQGLSLPVAASAASPGTPPEAAAGSAFEKFLQEDPARGRLTKNEQFAAYRKWRQQQGLNWSNS